MTKYFYIFLTTVLIGCTAPTKLEPIDNSMPALIRTGVVKTLEFDDTKEPVLVCNAKTKEVCYIKHIKKDNQCVKN
jgi:hypothetical protein